MTPIQKLIAKYEKSIKRLDQRIISNRSHPSRTTHDQSVMETYEEVVSDLRKLMPEDSSDWLLIEHNLAKYNYEASKNCKVRFDNGETLRHFQEWPISEATHFLPVSKEQNHQP